jgi:methionyl aminopeptidase
MIILKSPREIRLMREAGRIAAQCLVELEERIRPGVTTGELAAWAEEFIRSRGAIPTFIGYHGYPAAICTSVNDEVVHGIPGPRRLEEGDILSVDVGATYAGYVGDHARTFPVGRVSAEAARLMQVTREALERGIARAVEGGFLGDIAHAVQEHVEANGYSVVREYVGHGVGREMHEDPQVPNYGPAGRGLRLRAGLVIAIEPMVNAGGHRVYTMPDGWTVRTADGSLSAHFEHTVAVTPDGPEVLTLP